MLILIRGIPGSGKSTLAKELAAGNDDYVHLEADQFFIDSSGEYAFNPAMLPRAHDWCQKQAMTHLAHGKNVIVSNTFTRLWEMEAYINMAKEVGCELQVIRCNGGFENTHGVPQAAVDKMTNRFEMYRGEYIHLAAKEPTDV